MSFSGRFKKGYTSTSSPFSTYLRHAKSVFFLRKIKVFEGSVSILLLLLSLPFPYPMRPQNALKMSSKSSSDGYQIQLRFKKGFKIASKLVFEASMTLQPAPKSHPKLVWKLSPTPVQLCSIEVAIKTLFEAILDPFWKRFWTPFGAKLEQFWSQLELQNSTVSTLKAITT